MTTHILSVDDSTSMREVVKLALKLAGFEVSQAKDGVEALKMAQSKQYDLVLADLNMPNMDGIELIRQLRATPQYKSVPILMLTTESDLVRRHELGLAVDCTNPAALRVALLSMTEFDRSDTYREALSRFAARYAFDRFEVAVRAPFVPANTGHLDVLQLAASRDAK